MEQFEKVCKGLEKVWDAFNHMEHEIYADYVFDALALIRKQQERIAELEAAQQWISAKDRLPEKNTPVLWYVVIKDRGMGHCRLGTFDGAVNHEVPSVSCCGPNAIPKFWMPLPEFPEEGT